MSEARLEKIEGMLSQLILMVGKMNETQVQMQQDIQQLKQEQQEMKGEMKAFKQEQQGMKGEMKTFREGQLEVKGKLDTIDQNQRNNEKKNEERHHEVSKRLKSMEVDQDFVWEKAVRNERELAVLKRGQS